MKRTFQKVHGLLILCLAVLALASCKKDDDSSSSSSTTYSYSLVATINPMSGYSSTGNFLSGSWKADEELALMDISSSSKRKVALTNAGAGNTSFNGTSASGYTDKDKILTFYPAKALEMATSDTLTQVLNVNGQNGTLEGCMPYLYAAGASTIDVDNSIRKATINLSPLMALANLSFTYNGTALNKIVKISITDTEEKFHSAREYNLKSQEWKNGKDFDMTIQNNSGLNGNALIAVFPAENLNLQFILHTANGDAYQATCSSPVSFTAGQTTQVPEIECTPIETKAHVGDYFYDDNTWSATLDESKTCVGIVYTLCDTNGTPNASLTEGTSGRVVALQDASSSTYVWASVSEEIENSDSIQTADGTNASIELSVDKKYTSGAAASFKELPYTLRLVSNYYKANQICYGYGVGRKGTGSWSLPTAGDLVMIYQMNKAQKFKDIKGFEEFVDGAYWTSTIYGKHQCWAINFYSGQLYSNSKASSYYVRAITSF